MQNAQDHHLSKGVVVLVPTQDRLKGFYSNVLWYQSPIMGVCLILDPKSLNKNLQIPELLMESAKVSYYLS